MEDYEIVASINNLKRKYPKMLVKQVGAYIVIAANYQDLESKARKVNRGYTDGFYTIEQALREKVV